MKKQATVVEQIDFNKLRRDLQTLMEEVDRRLASEFDAFSPTLTAETVLRSIEATRGAFRLN